MDFYHPLWYGFGLLKRLRSLDRYRDIPVLVLTASADDRSRIKSYQYRADAYMNKPYDLAALTEEVRRLCCGSTLPR